MSRAFRQVDVFGAAPYRGNPVAVVHDADGLDDAAMQRFASWTNLSETTFLLAPTVPGADYRVRIFTPSRELPFAGHPTLGSAHAWLEAGGLPATSSTVVQECGVGLVPLRRTASGLVLAAPPTIHGGDVDPELREQLVAGLGVRDEDVLGAQWVDNGPGWVALQLVDASAVLALEPDPTALGGLNIGVLGVHPPGSAEDVEVRAFVVEAGFYEDPVTGSLNASLAQWLIGSGRLPSRYRARQGTRLGRHGVVEVELLDGDVWVGGATTTCVRGTVEL